MNWKMSCESSCPTTVAVFNNVFDLASTPPRAICVSVHDHLKVHRLNPVEALLPIAGAKYKGGEQERLGHFECYIYVIIVNKGDAASAVRSERIYALDLPRSSRLVVVGRACGAVHVVG